jgi:hypothetical protein
MKQLPGQGPKSHYNWKEADNCDERQGAASSKFSPLFLVFVQVWQSLAHLSKLIEMCK